jgi:hypothetical protein
MLRKLALVVYPRNTNRNPEHKDDSLIGLHVTGQLGLTQEEVPQILGESDFRLNGVVT